MTNNFFSIDLSNKEIFVISTLLILSLGLLSSIALLIYHGIVGLDHKFLGRFTYKVLLWGEVPMVFMLVYLLIHHKQEQLDNSWYDSFKEIYFWLILFHIGMSMLGSIGVSLHTYTNFENGQICKWNNILLVITLGITIIELWLLYSGSYINLPDVWFAQVGMWIYTIFVLGFIGPVIAHAMSQLNS